jgi:hypothetical protein
LLKGGQGGIIDWSLNFEIHLAFGFAFMGYFLRLS